MAITNLDELIDALANSSQSVVLNKTSVANTAAGQLHSMWRALGIPGAGPIPTTSAICSGASPGALQIANSLAGQNYIARAFMVSSVAATDLQIHDRLVAMGGLSGTSTSAQTVGVALTSTESNLQDRIGQSDYSDCQWWVEWYADTGGTARTLTLAATYHDNSTENVTVAVAATSRASRLMPIYPNTAGKYIKSISTATLNGTTGSAGNFGITVTRARTGLSLTTANSGTIGDWAMLGLPKLANDVCLQVVVMPGGTATGTLYGTMKIIEG